MWFKSKSHNFLNPQGGLSSIDNPHNLLFLKNQVNILDFFLMDNYQF